MMNPLLRRWSICCLLAIIVLFTIFNFTDPAKWNPFFQGKVEPKVTWKDVPQHFPVQSMIPLPSGKPVPIPKIQHRFTAENKTRKKQRIERMEAVKESFVHAWNGYKKHAWLQDEVSPISGGYRNDFGGWGATLVDTLDTLLIMGMDGEFTTAVLALKKIDFSTSKYLMQVNVFETTIRYLGGLLSAHDLSDGKYPILLEKAKELGEMLYMAFDTPNRMPVTRWNWEE
jgi:mannosyl-oligosaccharide alpha-1,2-mannosidase